MLLTLALRTVGAYPTLCRIGEVFIHKCELPILCMSFSCIHRTHQRCTQRLQLYTVPCAQSQSPHDIRLVRVRAQKLAARAKPDTVLEELGGPAAFLVRALLPTLATPQSHRQRQHWLPRTRTRARAHGARVRENRERARGSERGCMREREREGGREAEERARAHSRPTQALTRVTLATARRTRLSAT